MEELLKKKRGRPPKKAEIPAQVSEAVSRAKEEFYAVAGGLGITLGTSIGILVRARGLAYDDSDFWKERWARNMESIAMLYTPSSSKILPYLNLFLSLTLPLIASAGAILNNSPKVIIQEPIEAVLIEDKPSENGKLEQAEEKI